jgi:malate synthase
MDLFQKIKNQELENIRQQIGEAAYESGHYEKAAELLTEIIANPELEEFLTLRAYDYID